MDTHHDDRTLFLTRYVASHADTLGFFERFFGRAPDRAPQPNCREWDAARGLVFQVIEHAERAGETGYASVVGDLPGEVARLAAAGITEAQRFDVAGFYGLTYVEYVDPEGVRTGLLNRTSPATHA